MAKQKNPKTPAIHAMEKAGVKYTLMPYRYIDKGGTGRAAEELAVDHHQVINRVHELTGIPNTRLILLIQNIG